MKELLKALSEAGPEIKRAVFDKVNPHFKSKYASIGSVIEAITPALRAHGLWFIQHTHNTPGFASIETIIVHSSGESLSCGIISLPMMKNDSQGWGTACTYAKRYGLSTAFGVVADEDDDGNEACTPPPPPSKKFDPYPEPADITPEVKKLGRKEVEKLASKVVVTLGIDEEEGMVKYLNHCQNKGSDLANLEALLTSNKSIVLDHFTNWKMKQSD